LLSSFPGLVDFGITDECDVSYNCVGWTLDQVSPAFVWPWQGTVSDLAQQMSRMDALYGTHGFVRTTQEPPAGTVSVVALFSTVTNLTHVAVRDQAGSWWESKLGSRWRIVHRLNELEGGYYGQIVGYYKKESSHA